MFTLENLNTHYQTEWKANFQMHYLKGCIIDNNNNNDDDDDNDDDDKCSV